MDAVFSPIPAGADGAEQSGSTHLVTTARDTTAAIWALDMHGPAPRLTDPRVLAGHSDWVNSARFSPDGRRMLTVSDDGSAVYWDPDNPSGYVRLCGHARRVGSGQFSSNGAFIVTASADDTALVWDRLALDRHLKERLSDPGGDGGLLENLDCLAPSPVTPLMVLQGHTDDLTGAAFCGDDRYVVTASHDDTVRLWDLTRRAEPRILARGSSSAVGVDINWSGELIAAAFEADRAVVVDAEGVRQKTLGFAGSVDFIPERRASRDGDYVLTTAKDDPASRNRTLVLEWPVARGNPATLAEGGPFNTAVYGPDGDRFVTSNLRRFAEVRKVNRERLDCCEGYGRRNLYAEFSHDGTRIVTAMVNGTAVVGAAPGMPATGQLPEPTLLEGHAAFLTMATFSPDDRLVATASADGTIRVTPADDPGAGWQLEGHGKTVTSVAFSRDGKLLVSGSDDGTARIWNVDGSGEPIVLTADGSAIRSVKFTPDGRQVVTASNDGAVRVWRFLWEDLLQYLDDSTRICLTVEQRMDYLNEGREAARAGHGACEKRERNMGVRSGT
jgi:WD40 repeat protein